MSIRPLTCCRALQRQCPEAPESIWLSDEILFTAFQRFCAVSKTTRRYGSFVPGPLEARRRLGKRRMTHISEASPTYESQAAFSWHFLGSVDRTQWQWQAPTSRPEPKEKPKAILPDWLTSWSNKPDIYVSDEKNTVEDLPLLNKFASIEDEALEFQIQFPALNQKDVMLRWDRFSARFQQHLTLGRLPEKSIIRIRDLIWDMGGVFPKHRSTQHYRLRLYKVLLKGLKESKVLTPHDLGADTMNSFIMQVASLPFSSSVQRLLNRIFDFASTSQLEMMGPAVHFVLDKWSRSWLADATNAGYQLDSHYRVLKLTEALSASNEKLDELHGLVDALCDSKIVAYSEKGLGLEFRTVAVHAALNFTRAAIGYSENILIQTEKQIPMDAKSIQNLAKSLANVPQHIILPILSNHANCFAAEERWSPHFKACYMSFIAQLSVVDTQLSLKIRQDLELGGVNTLEPRKAFSILSHWSYLGFVDKNVVFKIINLIKTSVSSPDKNQLAFLIFSLHEQNQGTWGLLDVVFFLLQKQGRYQEILPILTQLHELGYKLPSVIFNNLVRSIYSLDLSAATSIYQLSHDMMPEGDMMEAYQNADFLFALVDDEQTTCKNIWEEVLRIPWYNPIPHDILKSLPKERLSINELKFFEQMALKFAHAECRPPGLAFANVNQVLWHIRQRNCKPTANISKAMCHAVITRDIARGGPTSGWIGPTRLEYVLRLVTELEGIEVAKEIAQLVKVWRQFLTDQKEIRKNEGLQQ